MHAGYRDVAASSAGRAVVCNYSTRNGLFDLVPKLLIPSVDGVSTGVQLSHCQAKGFPRQITVEPGVIPH